MIVDYFIGTFWRLHSSRSSSGFGHNPIPISEILTYLEAFPSPYSLDFSVDLIQRMDGVFFEKIRQDQERKSNG